MSGRLEIARPIESSESIRHNCGLVGIVTENHSKRIHQFARDALHKLQHRGEEAAGMAWLNRGEIRHYGDLGKVRSALPIAAVEDFASTKIVMGHTRYSTSGSAKKNKEREDRRNIQPYVLGARQFAIAQNGNDSSFNYPIGPDEPTTDTYKIGKAIFEGPGPIVESIKRVLSHLEGSYTFLFMTPEGLFVARDPRGITPAWIGAFENGTKGTVIASETIAFSILNAKTVGTVPRGVLARVTPSGIEELWKDPRNVDEAYCSFGRAYFERAPSLTFPRDDQKIEELETNHSLRIELGKRVAKVAQPRGNCVIAIPNSGWSYGEGVGQELGLRLAQAIHKDPYEGRTFIQANIPDERMRKALETYDFVPELIDGQEPIVVDDSIVRGHTIKSVIITLFYYRAQRIHLVSGIPPIIEICDKGIDFQNRNELIYRRLAENRLGRELTPDDLYNPKLRQAVETDMAYWLADGDKKIANRIKVSYQHVEDYKSIMQKGCFQCVDAKSPSGIIYPGNGSIIIPRIERKRS